MPNSVVSKSGKTTPNLWREAYSALSEDEKGKERLHKLNVLIKEQLGKPKLKLRSEDGYKQLFALIQKKSKSLEASRSSEKVDRICKNMLTIQDLVATGANVGGPYIAIPAAALFLAFSVQQIYRSEREAMFDLARNVAHYTVLNAKSHDRIKILPSDDADMKDLKTNLHMVYIGLYKSLLLASTQLAIALYGDWQFLKNITKHYDWEGQVQDLERQHHMCKEYRDEMLSRQNGVGQKPQGAIVANQSQKYAMGPAPRNPLHWAVALTVPEQVTHFVQKEEYPINALTPKRWTAIHLAARHGNTKIIKTLLTVDGIDLKIKNDEGSTPLHIAAMHNRVGAVKLLLQRTPKLLQMRDNRGWTAFLVAAQKGHVKVLEALKESGQDLNDATTVNGWTGLHLAADKGKVDAVKFLLANGTNKDTKTTNGGWKGANAKQVAERRGRLDIVQLL